MTPNILYIDCHDVGQWIGCYGKPWIDTPHLDGLAAGGIRFDRMVTTAPICMPSRSSLYSGRMPHQAGVTGQDPLDDSVPCIANHLRTAGYETVLSGRLLILNDPHNVGFDHVLTDTPIEESAAQFLTERSADSQPFFLSLSFTEAHRPFGSTFDPSVPDRLEVPGWLPDVPVTRKDLAALTRQVEVLDAKVGVVLDALRSGGHESHTLVVFASDHGPAVARAKHTLYDGGLLSTLLMRLPNTIPEGRASDALISGADLMPTILELSGLEQPGDTEGSSFADLARGTASSFREAAYSQMTWGRRSGRWFYTPARSVRTEHFKLIRNFHSGPVYIDNGWLARFDTQRDVVEAHFGRPVPEIELYDLSADPNELNNLAPAASHRSIRDDLERQLNAFLRETADPVLEGPVPNKEGCPDVPQWIEGSAGRFSLDPSDPLDPRESPFA